MLTHQEYKLLKRVAKSRGVYRPRDRWEEETLQELQRRGLVTSEKRQDKSDNPGKVFDEDAEEKSYKRYKHRCYRNLVLESLLAFLLGILLTALLKAL